jgi:hypothetical protein
MKSTWESRDLPVLDAVVDHFDEHGARGELPTAAYFAERTGLDVAQVDRAVKALSPTYLQAVESLSEGPGHIAVSGITDAARRAVGQWPSPEVWADDIIRALLEAAERESDPERRSRLRATAEGLAGFGRDVLVGVLSGGITQTLGSS